jgi:hypothetical protein
LRLLQTAFGLNCAQPILSLKRPCPARPFFFVQPPVDTTQKSPA